MINIVGVGKDEQCQCLIHQVNEQLFVHH